MQRLLVPGLGDGADVVLDDVHGHLDQVDGLLEGDHPDQLAGRGAEDVAGQPSAAGRGCGTTRPARRCRPGRRASPRSAGRRAWRGTRTARRPSGPRPGWPATPTTAPAAAASPRSAGGDSPGSSPRPACHANRRRGEWCGERSPGRQRGAHPEACARAVRPRWSARSSAWWCWRCSGPACGRTSIRSWNWTPTVSEALYAGDRRAGALDGLLEVLTAPGLSWVRVLVFLPVLVLLLRRRSWWTAAWLVTAVVLVAPLTGLLKELLRPGPARLRRGRCAVRLAELPERPLVGDRHPGHRGPDPGVAAARGPARGGGRSPWGRSWCSSSG